MNRDAARFISKALFVTIKNAVWDDDMIIDWIKEGLEVRARVREKVGAAGSGVLSHWATGKPEDYEAMMAKALSDEVRITATANQHVRSLRELLVIG